MVEAGFKPIKALYVSVIFSFRKLVPIITDWKAGHEVFGSLLTSCIPSMIRAWDGKVTRVVRCSRRMSESD